MEPFFPFIHDKKVKIKENLEQISLYINIYEPIEKLDHIDNIDKQENVVIIDIL
jgi:hypothetical protein